MGMGGLGVEEGVAVEGGTVVGSGLNRFARIGISHRMNDSESAVMVISVAEEPRVDQGRRSLEDDIFVNGVVLFSFSYDVVVVVGYLGNPFVIRVY